MDEKENEIKENEIKENEITENIDSNDTMQNEIKSGETTMEDNIEPNEEIIKEPTVDSIPEEKLEVIEENTVGKPPNANNKMMWYIAGIAVVAVIIIYSLLAKEPKKNSIIIVSTPTQSPTPEATPTPVPTPTPTSTPEATPTPNPAMDDAITDATWAFIDSALKDVKAYVDNTSIKYRLVSNGGLLYNINTRDKVDPNKVFAGNTYQNINLDNCSFLYVYPSDMKDFNNGGLKLSKGTDKEVFLAYKTKEGYAVSSLNSAGGVISEDEYNSLLAKYDAQHGDIKPVAAKSDDFNTMQFLALASMNKNLVKPAENIDTRYLYSDGHYAVMVTSPKDNPADIHGYVFENDKGQWKLVIEDFQTMDNYSYEINQQLPYMNTDLLPSYDVTYFSPQNYVTDMSGIMKGLLTTNQITNDDLPLVYGVGIKGAYFLEFESGKSFVGIEDSKTNTVTTYPVTSQAEAAAYLEKYIDKPIPYIILKQY